VTAAESTEWRNEAAQRLDFPPSGSRALSSRSTRNRALDWAGIAFGAATLLAARGTVARNGTRWGQALGAATLAASAAHLLYGTRPRSRADHVRTTLRVNREPQELYRFWRELKNLPRFIQGLESVETSSEVRSRWSAAAGTRSLAWDVELIADEPGRRIAWCSLPGSAVFHCGSVRFEPARGGRGTLVRMDLQSAWPAAGLVDRALRRFSGAERRVKEDLRRFKRLVETGEIPTTSGQSSGRARKAARQEAAC
jgi:uncharacterized membrane protein